MTENGSSSIKQHKELEVLASSSTSSEKQRPIRIVSWNVGMRGLLRTISSEVAESMNDLLEKLNADILCLQETKLSSRTEIPQEIAFPENYVSYFSFNRLKNRPYSGTATFVHKSLLPHSVYEGVTEDDNGPSNSRISVSQLNGEGRVLVSEHSDFTLMNVYCPARSENSSREDYKWEFHCALEQHISNLQKQGKIVIVAGDINIAHQRIDHCDPKSWEKETGVDFHKDRFREWMDRLVDSTGCGLVDSFRRYFPDAENCYTCWNTKTGARKNNYGTRIDYVLVSSSLVEHVTSAGISHGFYGSDHCPIHMELPPSYRRGASQEKTISSSLCSLSWPEIYRQQTQISSFLTKTENKEPGVADFFSGAKGDISGTKRRRPNGSNTLDTFVTRTHQDSSQNFGSSSTYSQDVQYYVGQEVREETKSAWANLLRGPLTPPKCSKHEQPCVERTVKNGQNRGRNFYVCCKPPGKSDNPEARCNFFMWKSSWKKECERYREKSGAAPR